MFTPARRPPSPTGYVDSRSRECSNGSPRCTLAPAPAEGNPLGLCSDHLTEYRKRCGIPEPVQCPACNPCAVWDHSQWVTICGAMCFACGLTNGGTVASASHRFEARGKMIARIAALLAAGDRGAEWVALLARCPADVRERAERRIAEVAPSAD